MSVLRDLQQAFQASILRGELAAFAPQVLPGRAGDTLSGMSVYTEGYTARLAEVLAGDFPNLRSLIGETEFAALTVAYLSDHPSIYRNVRSLGERLPAWLSSRARYRAEPHLAELADFEWTLGVVFDAAAAPSLQPDALAAVPPADWPALRFAIHPAVRIAHYDSNIVELWRATAECAPR